MVTDPEGDDIYYNVTWGCSGCETHTYGPFQSGVTTKINHSWGESGSFLIRAKANDIYGAEGPEGAFDVKIPRSRVLNGHIIEILQLRFQRLIQILQFIF
jgi:hypothetical protein